MHVHAPLVALLAPRTSLLLMSVRPGLPSVEATPEEVVSEQLRALSEARLPRVFQLFSRARRAMIMESGRAQGGGGQLDPPPQEVQRRVRRMLDASCPGLIGHGSHEIVSGLTLDQGGDGRMPRWGCRVRVHTFHPDMYDTCDGGFLAAAAAAAPPSYYLFTLTRQSRREEPRSGGSGSGGSWLATRGSGCDGNEGCWFVWSVERERNGGGGDDQSPPSLGGPPERERALPEPAVLVG